MVYLLMLAEQEECSPRSWKSSRPSLQVWAWGQGQHSMFGLTSPALRSHTFLRLLAVCLRLWEGKGQLPNYPGSSQMAPGSDLPQALETSGMPIGLQEADGAICQDKSISPPGQLSAWYWTSPETPSTVADRASADLVKVVRFVCGCSH